MLMVYDNLYIGNQNDYENENFTDDFSFVLAAKNPWHKDYVGYEGKSCSKDHPEYLKAYRENKLILNLVDAPKSMFFDKGLIDSALDFIDEALRTGKNVLIACNKGESRSASIALLWLMQNNIITGTTLEDCEVEFLKLYPNYNPGAGMRGFVKEHFNQYRDLSNYVIGVDLAQGSDFSTYNKQ